MKTKNILSIAAVAVIVFSTMAFTTIKNKKVKVSESAITWKAYKITGSSHEGTIGLKEGNLEFDGKNLTGGSFVVDMSSMACTDLSGDSKSSLEGHLKSDDFFNVKEFPTAKYVIKNVRGKDGTFKVNGDMTIKGKTSTVSLTFIIKDNTAKASFKVDRTKFGITYGSASFIDGLKDRAINDEFDLTVSLKF